MAGVAPALVSDRSVQELLLVVGRKLAPDLVRLVGRVIRQHGRVVVWVGLVGGRLAQMPHRPRDHAVSADRQHSVPGNRSRLNQRSRRRRLLLLAEVPRRADSPAQPI